MQRRQWAKAVAEITIGILAVSAAPPGLADDTRGIGTPPRESAETRIAQNADAPQATTPVKEPAVVKEAIATLNADARLGARLFYENRLSNPGANLATSCRSCHVPPAASNGGRMWADYPAYSVLPANDRGGKLETRRNTPTLLDLDMNTSYGLDGAHDELDSYLGQKLTSEYMGWAEGDTERAKDEIFALLLNDDGSDTIAEGTYIEQFKTVKDVDVESLDREAAFQLVIASLTDYLMTVKTHNTSAYDAFVFLNRLMEAGERGGYSAGSRRTHLRTNCESGRPRPYPFSECIRRTELPGIQDFYAGRSDREQLGRGDGGKHRKLHCVSYPPEVHRHQISQYRRDADGVRRRARRWRLYED